MIDRIFSAGLALETALGLLDGRRRAAGRIQDALGDLDLAIRDVRNILFDHNQPVEAVYAGRHEAPRQA